MKIIIEPTYAPCEDFLRALPERFATEGEVLYAGRNTVKRFTVGGEVLVVKRFKRPNLVQRVVYTFFRQSKAERAYLFAAQMRALGIDTPHEAAYLELKRGGLLLDSYFASAECRDPELRGPLNAPDCPEALITALAKFLVEVHRRGVMHGDLNLTNILFRPTDNGGYHFTLIDTNRSRFLTAPTQQQCLHNLRTLTHNRELMRRIVTAYCDLQGWNVNTSLYQVFQLVDRMERHHRIKRRWQRALGLRK
jgi:tRNA A-37 threonylcarbamoyl transferase component Bud32